MRKLILSLLALIVATGAFWAVMLTTPPTTVASVPPVGAGINVYDMMAGVNLPEGEQAPTH